MNGYLGIFLGTVFILISPHNVVAEPLTGTAEVLSGETLKIDGKTFRLQGIDAPEEGQICKNKIGKPFDCGRIAATGLMDLTAGATVQCEAAGKGDMTPILATCSAGGYDLSEGMVYTGWALPDPQTGAALTGLRKQAENKKHGLWAGQFDLPWIWRKRNPEQFSQ